MSKGSQTLIGRKIRKGTPGVGGDERKTVCVSDVSIECARSEGLEDTLILNGGPFARRLACDTLASCSKQMLRSLTLTDANDMHPVQHGDAGAAKVNSTPVIPAYNCPRYDQRILTRTVENLTRYRAEE